MSEPTPVETLLPPNAIDAERALEGATARLGSISVPVGTLWSPETCPENLLAWLAWALSVDEWNPQWDAATKRAVIAESVGVHLHKGSVASVKRALDAIGFTGYTLTEWWQPAPEDGLEGTHTGEPHTYSLGINPLDPGPEFDPELFQSVLRTLAHTAPVRSHLALYVPIPSAAELGIAAAWAGYTHVHVDMDPVASGFQLSISEAELGIAAAWAGYSHVHVDMELSETAAGEPLGPGDVSDGLQLWFKADDLDATYNDDDPIDSWTDASGHEVEVSESGSERPTYKTAILNGHSVVRFNGSNKLSTSNPLNGVYTGFTVFAVTTNVSPVTWGAIIAADQPGNRGITLFYAGSTNSVWLHSNSNSTKREGQTTIVPGPSLVTGLYDGSGPEQHLYFNGSLDDGTGSTIPPSFTDNNATLWLGNDGFDDDFVGDIAEIAFYNRALTTPEREAVEAALMSKYGIS